MPCACGWEEGCGRLHSMKCRSWDDAPRRRECGLCLGRLAVDGCELEHADDCPYRRAA